VGDANIILESQFGSLRSKTMRLKHTFFVICLVAAVTLIAVFTAKAQKSEERSGKDEPGQTYGAIAFGEGGGRYSSGWARNYPTQEAADQNAIEQCGRSACKVVMRFWGKYCGAVARGSNAAWGSSSAATEDEARRAAVRVCRVDYGGTGCEVLAVTCNEP
jgi:hypothetical protein